MLSEYLVSQSFTRNETKSQVGTRFSSFKGHDLPLAGVAVPHLNKETGKVEHLTHALVASF